MRSWPRYRLEVGIYANLWWASSYLAVKWECGHIGTVNRLAYYTNALSGLTNCNITLSIGDFDDMPNSGLVAHIVALNL